MFTTVFGTLVLLRECYHRVAPRARYPTDAMKYGTCLSSRKKVGAHRKRLRAIASGGRSHRSRPQSTAVPPRRAAFCVSTVSIVDGRVRAARSIEIINYFGFVLTDGQPIVLIFYVTSLGFTTPFIKSLDRNFSSEQG